MAGGRLCPAPGRPGRVRPHRSPRNILLPVLVLGIIRRCHAPRDHSDSYNSTRGTYARSRIPWERRLNCGSFRTQRQGQVRLYWPLKPRACVGVICIRIVRKAGQPPSAFVVVRSPSLPGMSRVAWWQRWGLASARHKRGWAVLQMPHPA